MINSMRTFDLAVHMIELQKQLDELEERVKRLEQFIDAQNKIQEKI
jgi:hypothetical protein